MTGERALKLVEFVLWVVVASALVVGVSFVIGLAIGGDLVAVKYATFVFGVVIFGVGSLAIQPESPRKQRRTRDGHDGIGRSDRVDAGGNPLEYEGRFESYKRKIPSVEGDEQNRLEAHLQEIPPLRDRGIRFERRVGRPLKVFVTGLVVLGVSALMEFGLGVSV